MNVLETERLILRQFELSDAEPMFRNWASNPNVTKFLTWPAHDSVKTTKAVIQNWIEEYKVGKLNWAIVLKEINEPIGSMGVVEINQEINEASLGYCIGENWWGQGITAEALTTIIKYLFEEKGFNRVTAIHDLNNPNSGRVMKKAGLFYEGTLKQAGKNNQGVIDVVVYGLTKEDYLNN